MSDRTFKLVVSIGLATGGILGMAGTFAPTASLRGILWGIDGIGLVLATALLTVAFYRRGEDVAAAGFLVFCIGESLLLAGAAQELAASGPGFGAGVGLWALGLALISSASVWPFAVRVLGFLASLVFAVTALQIFGGKPIDPLTSPLPYYGYPVLVATLAGWIVTLWRPTPAPKP